MKVIYVTFLISMLFLACKKDTLNDGSSDNGNSGSQGGPYYLKFQRDGENFIYQNGLNGYTQNSSSSKYIYDSIQNKGILSFSTHFGNNIVDSSGQYGELQFYYDSFEFNSYFGNESTIMDSLFYVGIHEYSFSGGKILFRKFDANSLEMADNEYYLDDPNSFFEIIESVEVQSSPIVKRRIKGTFNCKIKESNSGATRIIENGEFNAILESAQ